MGRCRGRILAPLLLAASCVPSGPSAPQLVLLLSVDTLRADRLGAYGSARGLTPRLDALAAESEVFEAAYAPTSHTLPSVAGMLTGRHPRAIGVTGNRSTLPGDVTTLAADLRAAGWRTGAVVSNWVLRSQAGLDRGFDHYDDALPQREATRPMPERLAADTTDAALRLLDACLGDGSEPCFLWVHYQDPHGPYTPDPAQRALHLERERAEPDGRRELPALPGSFGLGGIPDYQLLGARHEVAFYRAGYDAEVAAVDRELGRLLDAVEERGLRDRTLIVFTADHGEALGEGDLWFGHGELLHEVLVRVPLLVRAPGREPRRRDDVASLLDLRATLLDLLGTEPTGTPEGRALLAPGAEDAASTPFLAALQGSAVPRYGLVDGEFQYVVTHRDGVWQGRLTRRGAPDVDLAAAAPQLAAKLRRRLEHHVEDGPVREPEEPALSPEDHERLEALGYGELRP